MNIACIIGARKGSKRLPGKNKLNLHGKPLYLHTVEAAITSKLFKEIIFTSDDEDIIRELKVLNKITIDKRPANLSDDQTTMFQVGEYIVKKYDTIMKNIEALCFLSPCHPFRNKTHLIESVSYYKKANATSLISITEFPSPPELFVEVVNNKIKRQWSGALRKSNYTKKYYPNGAIILVKKTFFIENKEYYSTNTIGYKMNWPDSIDIDTIEEFEIAQRLL